MRKKDKLQAANLEGTADDVEDAFYRALQEGDIDKLMACWADEVTGNTRRRRRNAQRVPTIKS